MRSRNSGFTLPELLIVCVLIGLLSTLFLSQIPAFANTAQWQISNPNDELEIHPVRLDLFFSRTPQKALQCMSDHERERWERKMPDTCKRSAGVRGYTTEDIKRAIQREACKFQWKEVTVERVVNGKVVKSSIYKIRPGMCD